MGSSSRRSADASRSARRPRISAAPEVSQSSRSPRANAGSTNSWSKPASCRNGETRTAATSSENASRRSRGRCTCSERGSRDLSPSYRSQRACTTVRHRDTRPLPRGSFRLPVAARAIVQHSVVASVPFFWNIAQSAWATIVGPVARRVRPCVLRVHRGSHQARLGAPRPLPPPDVGDPRGPGPSYTSSRRTLSVHVNDARASSLAKNCGYSGGRAYHVEVAVHAAGDHGPRPRAKVPRPSVALARPRPSTVHWFVMSYTPPPHSFLTRPPIPLVDGPRPGPHHRRTH